MNGGQNKQPLGYTIIEVMIVLAISGVMFLIASTVIGGKQEQSSFTSGVNDMASDLQDVVEQVTDGRYSDVPISCSWSGSGSVTIGAATGVTQGSNAYCVFLGKLLYFPGLTPGTPVENYQVLSVAGGQTELGSNLLTSLDATGPKVATELTTTQGTSQSLDVSKITINNGVVGGKTAFGFIQSLGTTTTSGGTTVLQSGAQNVGLYYVNGGDPTTENLAGKLIAASSVDLCMTDEKRYADVILGPDGSATNNGSSGQLSVNIKMDGETPC